MAALVGALGGGGDLLQQVGPAADQLGLLFGRGGLGGLAIEVLQVGQQLLHGVAGRRPLPLRLRCVIEAWKKKPVVAVVGLALAGGCGAVDHPPRVADLDQRADLHLAVLAAAFDDGHDVFVDAQVLWSTGRCRPERCPAGWR